MKNYTLRMATEADVPKIRQIYEPYVKSTAITFETELPAIEEFRNRVKSISMEYPYIVSVLNAEIVGYAYAHRHMERAAYQWNAELSVYIDKDYHRCGIGKRLYWALMEILKLQNVKNVYGGITSPNEKSERLHEALGFRKLGTYHSTGYKCGAWHDVAWFEKTIGVYSLEPAPFVPIQEIEKEAIIHILRAADDA